MKCPHCKDTKKYKKPNNQERFDRIVDTEMEKGYFVNYEMAEEKAYKEVGFTIVDCPYCSEKQFSLPTAPQILRGDRSWSPLSLCLFRLLLGCNFRFHRFYKLGELFLAFLSCLGVHVLGYAFAVLCFLLYGLTASFICDIMRLLNSLSPEAVYRSTVMPDQVSK